jgi:hypothetical protein
MLSKKYRIDEGINHKFKIFSILEDIFAKIDIFSTNIEFFPNEWMEFIHSESD